MRRQRVGVLLQGERRQLLGGAIGVRGEGVDGEHNGPDRCIDALPGITLAERVEDGARRDRLELRQIVDGLRGHTGCRRQRGKDFIGQRGGERHSPRGVLPGGQQTAIGAAFDGRNHPRVLVVYRQPHRTAAFQKRASQCNLFRRECSVFCGGGRWC